MENSRQDGRDEQDEQDEQDGQEMIAKHIFNPVPIQKFSNPYFNNHKDFVPTEFTPNIKVVIRAKPHRILRENNLGYFIVMGNRDALLVRIVQLAIATSEARPESTQLVIDYANKRVRVVGPSAYPEWVKIDKIPIHGNKGKRTMAPPWLLNHYRRGSKRKKG